MNFNPNVLREFMDVVTVLACLGGIVICLLLFIIVVLLLLKIMEKLSGQEIIKYLFKSRRR